MPESQHYKLVGIGNPLLDIIAPVDEAFLKRAGLKSNNAILVEDKHLPLYEELKKSKSVKFLAGGCTLNTVRVFQWILKKHSSTAAYFGCVGADENAKILRKSAKANRVNLFLMVDPEKVTGVCGVGILNKERTLFTNLSSANSFNLKYLDKPEVKKAYESADIIYISGFFLTVSIDSILRVASHCAETGKLFVLNLSADFLIEFYQENMKKALFYADVLVMNQMEARCYARIVLKDENLSLQDVAKKISDLPKANNKRDRKVIITRGPQSTFLVIGSKVFANVVVDSLDNEKIVDLNGAGDAFVGGYLAGETMEKGSLKSIEWGHKAARYIIQRSGVSFDEPCDFVE